jgi:glutaredoxin
MENQVEITLFTRPTCSYCSKTKDLLLKKSNVNIQQIVLDHQQSYDEVKALMIKLSNGATTVPQIFVAGEFVPGGYTGLKKLQDEGKLDLLIAEKQVLGFVPFLSGEPNLKKEKVLREKLLVQSLDF